MKLKDILVLAFFAAALAVLYVYYNGKLGTLKAEKLALSQTLTSTQKELQSKTISLGVYQAQHARKDALLDELRAEQKRLKEKLGEYAIDGLQGIPSDILVEKVTGMTKAQIEAFLGKPATILGPLSEWWYYRGDIAHDPKTRKTFGSVQVLFDKGRVARVVCKD